MKNLMKKIRKSNKGFTLVELIIVIAIIAILTAVAAPQYIKYVDKARWGKDQSNAGSLQTAVETVLVDQASRDVAVSVSKVEFSTGGVTVTGDGTGTPFSTELSNIIGTLANYKVTNQGKYIDAEDTYTIVITDGVAAAGTWG